jgi:hypothetical protein
MNQEEYNKLVKKKGREDKIIIIFLLIICSLISAILGQLVYITKLL